MVLQQPGGSIKLTNVSLVRLKKAGKRFEIACYKNSVQAWRSGAQKDLGEVLQIESVFVNASKGQVAAAKDLKAAFGTSDVDAVILEILNKGDLQVGEKERAAQSGDLRKEILTIVSQKTVNPASNKPYTVTMLDKALSDLGFAVVLTKNAKAQALDAVKLLVNKKPFPIEKAKMRIRITFPQESLDALRPELQPYLDKIESEDGPPETRHLTALIDPAAFRQLDQVITKESRGKDATQRGKLDVV